MSQPSTSKSDKDAVSCRPADIWQIFKVFGPNSASVSLRALDAFSARKHAEAERVHAKRKEETSALASCHEEIAKLRAALATYEGGSLAKKSKGSTKRTSMDTTSS